MRDPRQALTGRQVVMALAAFLGLGILGAAVAAFHDGFSLGDDSPVIHATNESELLGSGIIDGVKVTPELSERFQAAAAIVLQTCAAAHANEKPSDISRACVAKFNGKTWNQIIALADKIGNDQTPMEKKLDLAR